MIHRTLLPTLFLLLLTARSMAQEPVRHSDGRWGYRLDGEWCIAPKYEEAKPFSEGLAAVRLYGKWGYINRGGRAEIAFKFDAAEPFAEGLARVVPNASKGLCGFVDPTGNLTIPARYKAASDFAGGIAAAQFKNRRGFIDRYGIWYDRRDAALLAASRNPRMPQPEAEAAAPADVSSDVDREIPHTGRSNERLFAVIVANEHYKRVDDVQFAYNDGETFRRYCLQTLGIPAQHIEYYADATRNDLVAAMEWIARVAEYYEGHASVIFYYAGHGIPDERTQDACILPTDGLENNSETAYSLSELYDRLGQIPARSVTLFLDACFSGMKRNGERLVAARGVAIRPKAAAPSGRMVVFAAAQGDQTAHPWPEQRHGLFTYYLLKKLQQSDGAATLGELSDYLGREVGRTSMIVNRREQTPAVSVSPALAQEWRQLTLR